MEWSSGEFKPITWSLLVKGTGQDHESYTNLVTKFADIASGFKKKRPEAWQLFCAEVTNISSHAESLLAQGALLLPDSSYEALNDFMNLISGK